MKIGLVARDEYARGLAIQSKNFYDNMPVERVLLVKMPNPDCASAEGWYPGATVVPSLPGHTLHEPTVREWMDGLDVVFTVETPYDWQLPRWAREMGVATVIQGNPEFVRHGTAGYEWYEHPTEWWWPTSWRLEHLPRGRVMPVPMPAIDPAPPAESLPLRCHHVVGKRAFADRNGTNVVIDALRSLRGDIEFTLHGLDHCLPPLPQFKNVRVDVRDEGVADRWEMYRGQHLLVMPRRYGGLCLPALEAAASGNAVLMTDVEPNRELASILVPARNGRNIQVAAGVIPSFDLYHVDLAARLNHLAANPHLVAQAQAASVASVPLWSEWRDRYLAALADLL